MQASFSFTTPSSASAPSANAPISARPFEGVAVRIVMINDAPWWVLVDVCRVLDIRNPSDAAARLDSDEKMTLGNTEGAEIRRFFGPGAAPTLVNESGVYSLTITSRKPEAKRFKKWITSEVLPSIRRTGSYHAHPAPEPTPAPALPPMLAQQALAVIGGLQTLLAEQQALAQEHRETIHHQSAMLNASMPKASVYDRIASADGSMCISDAAKILGVGPRTLFKWMDAHNWIFKRGREWLGREEKSENGAGYLTHIVTTILHPDGREITRKQARVTAKGLTRLGRLVPGAQTKGMPIPAPTKGVVQHGGFLRGNRRSQEPAEIGPDEMDAAGRGSLSWDEYQQQRSIH
ncbi:phage antirepressor KilAC domain-containing protein [Acidomonas methanolica]|uniref:Phage associated-antirepressor BRO n=2 Tax=Acidomonas methanolica TaxID=437 RepID=A0A023D5Z3_ACIMT|nr:phage antirepressor KilAC domain-containing protein [Acidomonas methanolica]GAJ29572.1 phage associated-antirepressor BRO [Acidomonas methanolica NBRC 104435]GEK99332.1 hypothetical protein AME01nite_18310 [Acidomonas methanolica NBRC 104435]